MFKKRLLKIVAAAVILFGIAMGSIYGLGISKYKDRFLNGTYINGMDCSDLRPEQACELLDRQIADYTLEVSGRNPGNPEEEAVLGKIGVTDISMKKADTEKYVRELFAQQKTYLWFQGFFGVKNEHEIRQEITFEAAALEKMFCGWDACIGANVKDPVNAYISEYQPEENAYRIVPETRGSRLDYTKALPVIEQALYDLADHVDIEGSGCYSNASITSDDSHLKETVADLNRWLGAEITYDWYGNEVIVNHEQIKDWVRIDDGAAVLDEDAIREFIRQIKKECDPNGNIFTVHTALGSDLNLKCKSGWTTDQEAEAEELIALVRNGSKVSREPVSKTKNYVTFRGGVGGSYVEADMTNQHMYLYVEGELILETDFVSGNMSNGHRTPEGIYAVTYKTKDRILRGPDYESFVHYWMPFYGDYGMHDATWRGNFGGEIYQTNGSHGCLNLPLKNAEKIYGYVQTGFPVICYYYPEGMNPADRIAEEIQPDTEMEGGEPASDPALPDTGSAPENTVLDTENVL